jgi:group I intron endonuclease
MKTVLTSVSKESGIYQILNKVNQHIYIGSAINFYERFRRHRKDLRGNRHHSIILQRAYNKYGEHQFIFQILKICNPSQLCKHENSYLTKLKPTYNVCPIADSQVGRKHTTETKEKLRQFCLQNNVRPPLSTYKYKSVWMQNRITGKRIRKFKSISDACRFIGKSVYFGSTISKVCREIRQTAFGYKWSWA